MKISQAGADKLPTAVKLQEYSYATGNGTGDLANGKLKWAWTKNIALAGSTDPTMTAEVKETYTYGGTAGAVSNKSTWVTVAGSTTANPVQTFNQAFTFTDLGLLASQSYPTCANQSCAEEPGRSVYTTYAAGLPTAVGPYYSTAITYHPSGMTADITHAKRIVDVGAGIIDHQSIATDAMARPARIWSEGAITTGTGATADWDTGAYAYDGAGNITAMGSDTFDYDKVSRLTSATVSGFGSEGYSFDAYGNLTKAGGLELPTSTSTNRLDDPDHTGAAYDAAGNLTAYGLSPSTTTYTYTLFNQLGSVSGPFINRSQAYTADGERIFVRDGTTYLFTLRDLGGNVIREYEYSASGGWRWRRDNIFRGGLLLVSETRGEGIRHYTLDHLGSPRLVTNRTGEKLTLFATSPFGRDPTATQSTERMRFTVHERDLGSLSDTLDDIDSMHARSYRPMLGRFTSIDPVRGNPAAPQTFNLFAYVNGNPINNLDPMGLMPNWKDGNIIKVIGEDPCPDAPGGVSCEQWEQAKEQDAADLSLRMRLALVASRISFDAQTLEYVEPADLISARATGYGLAGFADGVVPFWDPLASAGAYDPEFPGVGASQFFGGVSATAATAATGLWGARAAGFGAKAAIHPAHHLFSALGRSLPHVQLNWWRVGIKGSHRAFRIPFPRSWKP